jgi:beta-lactamase class C
MQKIIFLLFSCLCFNNSVLAAANDEQINNSMHNLMHKYAISGAAVIFYKDGEVHQYLYGIMNNKTRIPVESNTIFEIGSITKTFTSLMLAQNINAGEMKLNDKLVEYLNNGNNDSASLKKITLLELATHTSGLPYNHPKIAYNASSSTQNSKLLNQFLHTWNAPYPSGTATLYSNLGFALLGIAIAEYEEDSLASLMQKSILQPLNMNSSYLTVPGTKNHFYAQGYNAKGIPARTPQGGLLAGSWAMKASVNDMAKYLQLALGLGNMPPSMVAAMKIAQSGYFEYSDKSEIGLAWMIHPLDKVNKAELLKVLPLAPRKRSETYVSLIKNPEYNANALIEKTGATNGFRAYIGVIPDQKIGIVILVNKFIYDSNPIKHTGRQLLLNN